MQDLRPLWWSLDSDEERAISVRNTVEALERSQTERRVRALKNVQMYEGRRLEGLFPSAYFSSYELVGDQYDSLRLNMARSLVNTALAKVAGKQKPKAQFCVTDGDWSIKRKSKKLERFVEAVMMQRQGPHSDAWEVGRMAFRDACVLDMGCIKFTADKLAKKVRIERVLPWEIYVDPYEARYGQPLNIFHVYGYDRHKLIAEYPEAKDAIMDAPSLTEDTRGLDLYGYGAEVARMVRVREAWRLPISDDQPGKHSICVGNADLVKGEDYLCDFFPFEWICWEPWIIGMHGASLVDNVYLICEELNAHVQRRADAEKLCSNGITFYEEGTIKQEDLQDNRVGIAVPVRAGAQMTPTYTAPETTSQGSIQWGQQLQTWGHDFSGVSESSAQGTIDAGVTAGVAMRTKENIQSERFAIPWQTFESMMSVGATRQIIACVRALAEDDKGFSVKWPGGDFLESIDWADADLDDDQYTVSVQAVSGLVNTPSDRLQLASELLDRQIISEDAYLEIIQYKDISSELGRVGKQAALIDKYIENWKDATPEKEDAAIEKGHPIYRAPIKWLGIQGLTDAITQVGRAYLDAEMEEAPDYNLDFFTRYMGDCDALIQQLKLRDAQTQAAAAGKGPMAGAAPPAMGGPAPGPAPMPPPMNGAPLQ